MAFRDLIPWRRGERGLVRGGEEHPLAAFHREVNRLFEDFFRGRDFPVGWPWGAGEFVPRVDVRETDRDIVVSAELPGLAEKDIQVELHEDGLRISGEKASETEEEREGYVRSERSFGSFQRVVPLPTQVQGDKASAEFRNGVLTVTLPKVPEEQAKRRKIEIKPSQ